MHQDTRTHGSPNPPSRGGDLSVDGNALKASICPKSCRVPLPDTCCCCSLQAGVVLTGLFTFVTSSGFVILLATRNIGKNAVDISDVRATLTYIIFIVYGLLIPSSLLLIVGNLKEKYWIYVPWLICNIICVLLPILLIIWVFAEDDIENRESHDLDIAIAVYHAINGAISLWGEASVLSHYKKMYQRKFFVRRERERRSRGRYIDHFYPLPPPYAYHDNDHSRTAASHTDEQSGFNPDNLEGGRRRLPIPPMLVRGREIARSVSTTIRNAFRRPRRERSPGSPERQNQAKGGHESPPRPRRGHGRGGGGGGGGGGDNRNRQGQQAARDPTGNFMLGPHVTSVNVGGGYGAIPGASGVTVHREPLRNLSPSIPMPGVEESDNSEESSSAITNTTQEMVSTLTSLGSKELSRLSYWSKSRDSRDKRKKPKKNKHSSHEMEPTANIITMGVANVGMDYDENLGHGGPNLHRNRAHSPIPGNHTDPLPPAQDSSPPHSRPISPQLHRNPPISASQPIPVDSNQNLPPLYVGRAMRYADYLDGTGYQWGSHDFGLTDQNFRPPKPFVPQEPRQGQRQHRDRGPRMPMQVYQYGGYKSMDVFF